MGCKWTYHQSIDKQSGLFCSWHTRIAIGKNNLFRYFFLQFLIDFCSFFFLNKKRQLDVNCWKFVNNLYTKLIFSAIWSIMTRMNWLCWPKNKNLLKKIQGKIFFVFCWIMFFHISSSFSWIKWNWSTCWNWTWTSSPCQSSTKRTK